MTLEVYERLQQALHSLEEEKKLYWQDIARAFFGSLFDEFLEMEDAKEKEKLAPTQPIGEC